ncbi:hypothetical protein FOCC_FOCC004657 [Frankliniella occidentalis]|nr:hypothetical protein FOCC_FOCC004657 [Frankliniella occidentalis]
MKCAWPRARSAPARCSPSRSSTRRPSRARKTLWKMKSRSSGGSANLLSGAPTRKVPRTDLGE